MSMMVSFVLSFFPRDVLDEILNLIGSVSEGFPSYSSITCMSTSKAIRTGIAGQYVLGSGLLDTLGGINHDGP